MRRLDVVILDLLDVKMENAIDRAFGREHYNLNEYELTVELKEVCDSIYHSEKWEESEPK